jgi:hypothetical protein
MANIERNQKREERFNKLIQQSLEKRNIQKLKEASLPNTKTHPKKIILDNIIEVDGCWIWNKSITSNDYGKATYLNRSWRAHRLSYTLFKGEIPGNQFVCHKCDNPRCVNPEHLFLGSATDNMQDCVNKGRYKNVKKTKPEVSDEVKLKALIFIVRNRKMSTAQISTQLGVDIQTIRQLKAGVKYAHIVKAYL